MFTEAASTCPFCRTAFYLKDAEKTAQNDPLGQDQFGRWWGLGLVCPACKRLSITLAFDGTAGIQRYLVWPRNTSGRAPVPIEVPSHTAEDYTEACVVLADSPKASAALSRRCLQTVLREAAKVKHDDLSKEIQQVLDSKALPSYLADAIDGIRNVGNFAAHPIKSKQTGMIEDVEPGEAEWSLDTLEGLFDFYYVQPALLAKKTAAINTKLTAAGKPPMKSP